MRFSDYEKTKSFLYRLFNGLLYTNKDYHQFGVMTTPKCLWCHEEQQTLIHLFAECEAVKDFRKTIIQRINTFLHTNRQISEQETLLKVNEKVVMIQYGKQP